MRSQRLCQTAANRGQSSTLKSSCTTSDHLGASWVLSPISIYRGLTLPILLCVILIFAAANFSLAADEPKLIETSSFTKFEGFLDFYWDDNAGKIWLRLADSAETKGALDTRPFLYVSSLATGLGSNPVGLDRGQLGADRLVHFKRVGKQIFLEQENVNFRAVTDNELERQAVRESFAPSILWSGTARESDAGTLVDFTDFLLRDAHDCIGTLSESDQGSFTLDKARSFVHLPRTKSFPRNSEFEVTLTFASSQPGRLVNRVSADGTSVTLRQHHSFVQLPEPGYVPRRWDPRAGCFSVSYADYATPIDAPLDQHWITRHRLQKVDPNAARSKAKEPIVYYVDPGVPQPVRDALVEGASWWNDAFESAGFEDAFQVKVLPPDADPMDVRYNVIQWVHRATRGWSYGQSFIDPRTGEIIKGHVLLGSLRVRQDHLLFKGLGDGKPATARASSCGLGSIPSEAHLSQLDPNLSSSEVALARIRQLSAHEVGHTLGFAHNFAASTYADRASVMDYPAPRVQIVDGQLDLQDAYGVGIGAWDKFAVQYAYSEFANQDEAASLKALVQAALSQGYRYITDADSRPAGAAHPLGNLWDNGSDPIESLRHEMRVREIAIDGFDASALHSSQALGELEKAFVPVYLHHRYQVEATAKMLGGYIYSYAFSGDGQTVLEPVPEEQQRRALNVLLTTLQPAKLVIPERILKLMPPKTHFSYSDSERFESQTGPIFDRGATIQAAAELTLGCLFQAQRASRLVRSGQESNALGTTQRLGLRDVIRAVAQQLSPIPPTGDLGSVMEREARRVVERVFVDKLIHLSSDSQASADAQQIAAFELERLRSQLRNYAQNNPESYEAAQWNALSGQISRALSRPFPEQNFNNPIELPPGSPIGQ